MLSNRFIYMAPLLVVLLSFLAVANADTGSISTSADIFDETGLLQTRLDVNRNGAGTEPQNQTKDSKEARDAKEARLHDQQAASIRQLVITLVAFVSLSIAWNVKSWLCCDPRSLAPYVAEFIGTYALVFTIGCAVITGTETWSILAIASVLMAMIYSTGSVSGGNLNPAVSLALYMAGKADMTLGKMLRYWIVQIVAGICAGKTYCALLSSANKTVAVAPGDGLWPWHGGLVEIVYTCMLAFVVLNVAMVDDKAGNSYYGLSIGFTIVAGGYAAGGISGAAFNPAVALGLQISSGSKISYGFMWSAFELGGGVLAALLFKLVRSQNANGKPTLISKLISEFLGTFFLVFTVALNLLTNSAGSTALSAAAALMSMIYALGDVSGAHFNPAVTVACYLRGAIPFPDPHRYMAMQLIAAACAGVLSTVFYDIPPQGVPHLVAGSGYSALGAGFIELMFTTILAYTVLSTATLRESNQNFGLAIGFCVVAGGFAGGAVSGGELNPAVSLGIVLASRGTGAAGSLMTLVIFVIWELSGGILAAILFHLTHPVESRKLTFMQQLQSNLS